MAEQGWPQHAVSIGVFEFRRSVRAIWQDKARFALMVIGVLIPSLIFGAFAVVFADAIRGFDPGSIPDQLRGMIALFWLFGVFLIGQRVVSARTHIEAEPLMLTTVSARTVAGGLLIAELLRILAYVSLPALMLTGASIYLFGTVASLIFVPATVLLFAATTVVTGAVFGYATAWLVATSPFVARHKTVLSSVVAVVGMGGYFVFLYPQFTGVSQAALAWLPMAWFADLAVVGTPITGSLIRLVGVLVGSGIVLLVGGAIIERETSALWFTDPISIETDDTSQRTAPATDEETIHRSRGDALAAAVTPFVIPRVISTPVRRVAEWALLRTRRDPNRLTFIMIPIFAVGSPVVSTSLESSSPFALLAPLCPVVVPWLAGALFAMNPFGDEGAVLPVTLTAVSGTKFVRGLMVPGLVFGLPVGLLLTAVVGVLSPYTFVEQAGLIGLSVYATCVAVAITPAIGMALPRFSAIRVGQSREVLPPRMSAVALHVVLTVVPSLLLAGLITVPRTTRAVLAGVVGGVPAILLRLLSGSDDGLVSSVATWFAGINDAIQSIPLDQLQIVGGGVVVLGGIGVSLFLYRNAIQRFNKYSLA